MIAKDDWNYETTVAQIEDVLDAIEGGELGLVEVFDQAEVIKGHLRQCEEFLAQQQGRVDLLVETLVE